LCPSNSYADFIKDPLLNLSRDPRQPGFVGLILHWGEDERYLSFVAMSIKRQN